MFAYLTLEVLWFEFLAITVLSESKTSDSVMSVLIRLFYHRGIPDCDLDRTMVADTASIGLRSPWFLSLVCYVTLSAGIWPSSVQTEMSSLLAANAPVARYSRSSPERLRWRMLLYRRCQHSNIIILWTTCCIPSVRVRLMPVLFRHYFSYGSAFLYFSNFVQAEQFRRSFFQYSRTFIPGRQRSHISVRSWATRLIVPVGRIFDRSSSTAVARSTLTHPMRMLMQAICASSFLFVLPVSTPPKAIGFGTPCIQIEDFLKGGFLMNIVAVVSRILIIHKMDSSVFAFES